MMIFRWLLCHHLFLYSIIKKYKLKKREVNNELYEITRQAYIVRQLDWLDINKRTMLATFAKRNIDVMTVAHAHQLAAYMNYRMGKDEKEGYFGWLGNTAMDFFGGAAAFEYHHMERFDAAIDDVKAKLLKLKSLAGLNSIPITLLIAVCLFALLFIFLVVSWLFVVLGLRRGVRVMYNNFVKRNQLA